MWVHSQFDMGNSGEIGSFGQDIKGKDSSKENPHSAYDKGGR